MAVKQRTLKGEVKVSGVGLHSGQQVSVCIKPAPENTWFQFKRVDVEDSEAILAVSEFVVDTSRGTTIESKGNRIATIEHLMAAFGGLQIDNALIEVNGPEIPILDGSAAVWIQEIKKVGIEEQQADRKCFRPRTTITKALENTASNIKLLPGDTTDYTVMIDYKSEILPPQFVHFNPGTENFEEEIAKARTFVFLQELEVLFNNNLIKGGDLTNAIVFADKHVAKSELDRIAGVLGKKSVEVGEDGVLSNISLYFNNEPARHKLLDLMGDMMLLGAYTEGSLIATCPGHTVNVAFVNDLRKQMKKESLPEGLPEFDINKDVVYDINQIKQILPHRPPFLLVDKIVYMDEGQVIGVKNVTMNEPFFVGHFPAKPVMPGVLQIEAMAQVGGLYMLTQLPDPENYLTYFVKIDQVKFRKQVIPGDTLVFKLIPASPFRRGLCHMKGWAYVGDQIVVEAELLAQLVKKN